MLYWTQKREVLAAGSIGPAAWVVYQNWQVPSDGGPATQWGKWFHWEVRRQGREDGRWGMEDSVDEATSEAEKQAAIMAGGAKMFRE